MSWFYAENNQRRGPIEDSAFDAMVAAGVVRPETLVWREGMTGWAALSASGYDSAKSAAPPGMPPAPPDADGEPRRPAVEMGVCSESGRILPRSELVEIDGRLVSAEYKNVVLQRIREGVGSLGSSIDPEVLAQQIMARDYYVSVGHCIGRAWALLKSNFWLCVGGTFLSMLVSQASSMVPLVGPILVFGPLTAGLYWMMLRMHRREPASLNDAFVGFNRNFGHLVGLGAVVMVGMMCCFIPAIIGFIAVVATSPKQPSPAGMALSGLLGVIGMLVMIYLWVSWIFAFPLVIDKQLEFWPAMKLSRRVVSMHWWQVFGVLFVTGLIMLAVIIVGLIVFGLGIAGMMAGHADKGILIAVSVVFGLIFFCLVLILMPLSYLTVSIAYEDIFAAPAGPR